MSEEQRTADDSGNVSLEDEILKAFGPDTPGSKRSKTPSGQSEAVEDTLSINASGDYDVPTRLELYDTLVGSDEIDPYLLKDFATEAIKIAKTDPSRSKTILKSILAKVDMTLETLLSKKNQEFEGEDPDRFRLARLESFGEFLGDLIQEAKAPGVGVSFKFALDLTGRLKKINTEIASLRTVIGTSPTEEVKTLMIDTVVRNSMDPTNDRGITPEYINNLIDSRMAIYTDAAKAAKDLDAKESKAQIAELIKSMERYVFRLDIAIRGLESTYVPSSMKARYGAIKDILNAWKKTFGNYREYLMNKMAKMPTAKASVTTYQKREEVDDNEELSHKAEVKRRNTPVSRPAIKRLTGLEAAIFSFTSAKEFGAIDSYLQNNLERIKKEKLGINGYKVALGEIHSCLTKTRDGRAHAILGRYMTILNKKIDRLEHPVRSIFADISSGVSKKVGGMFSFLKRNKKKAAAATAAVGAVGAVAGAAVAYDSYQERSGSVVESHKGEAGFESDTSSNEELAELLIEKEIGKVEEKKEFFESMVEVEEVKNSESVSEGVGEAVAPELAKTDDVVELPTIDPDPEDDDDEYTDDQPDFGTFELDPVPEDGTMWGRGLKAKHLSSMNMWDRLVAICIMTNKVTGRELTLFVDGGEVLYAPATLAEAEEIVRDAKRHGTYQEIMDAYREKRPESSASSAQKKSEERVVPKDRTGDANSTINNIKRMRRPGPRRDVVVQNEADFAEVDADWTAMLEDESFGADESIESISDDVEAGWTAMLEDESYGESFGVEETEVEVAEKVSDDISDIDKGWLDIDLDGFDEEVERAA